jgi:hypothetical protein
MPIEEAPFGILVLFTAILWLIAWPAVVGLLAGFGRWHGERLYPALGALGIAVGIVAGVATRKPWKRAAGPTRDDPRPLFVRFSTWLITALLIPNVLFGTLLLTRPATEVTYGGMVRLGLLVSLLHAVAAAVERWRRRPRA